MRDIVKILLQMLALALAAAAFVMLVLPYQAHAAPNDKLLEVKQTRAALYLEARDVPGFIAQQGGSSKVIFLDLRTRSEAMFVGMADGVDALVPLVELQELMTTSRSVTTASMFISSLPRLTCTDPAMWSASCSSLSRMSSATAPAANSGSTCCGGTPGTRDMAAAARDWSFSV